MSTVEEIRTAIRQLPPDDAVKLLVWFEEFAAERWDAELERDTASGRLDTLADEALDDLKAGRTRVL
jgi:hypothetical protein